MSHVISHVETGSPAHRHGVRTGDRLVLIDGKPVVDLFDYQWLTSRRVLTLTIHRLGQARQIAVRKRAEENMGLSFEGGLLGGLRKCANNCLFCFVHQLPEGLRESLYIKDDDWRFSVLMGNYVTLTNVPDATIDRICRMQISPLYVSVHATREETRAHLLGSRKHADVLSRLRRLADAGVTVHAQAVLCPGINDGEELEQTIADLSALHPHVASLALVPVGLTAHREGLPRLTAFTREQAAAVLDQARVWQHRMLTRQGSRFVFPTDEFYLIAGESPPPYEAYEDFPQIENGVGMIRAFEHDFNGFFAENVCIIEEKASALILTGRSAAPFLSSLLAARGLNAQVVAAENRLFGSGVSVAGLICGRDALEALRGKSAGRVLIPATMLRDNAVFLDDMTIESFSSLAGAPVEVIHPDGESLARALIKSSHAGG